MFRKTLWSLFMDRVQLPQEFTFYPLHPQKLLVLNWSTSEGWKAELTLSEPVVLNSIALDWKSNPLTTRLMQEVLSFKQLPTKKKKLLILFTKTGKYSFSIIGDHSKCMYAQSRCSTNKKSNNSFKNWIFPRDYFRNWGQHLKDSKKGTFSLQNSWKGRP